MKEEKGQNYTEIKNIDELLSKIKMTTNKSLPENYFDEFPSRMMDRVKLESITIPFYQSKVFKFSLAACLTLIIASTLIFNGINNKKELTVDTNSIYQINTEDLIYEEIDEATIIEVALLKQNSQMNIDSNNIDSYLNQIDENYLVEEL